MSTATTSSVTPFACAARISSRRNPNVQRPRAGRPANEAAASASPSAAASVSMCPASAISASEPATTPKTISPAISPTISASARASGLRAAVCSCEWLTIPFWRPQSAPAGSDA